MRGDNTVPGTPPDASASSLPALTLPVTGIVLPAAQLATPADATDQPSLKPGISSEEQLRQLAIRYWKPCELDTAGQTYVDKFVAIFKKLQPSQYAANLAYAWEDNRKNLGYITYLLYAALCIPALYTHFHALFRTSLAPAWKGAEAFKTLLRDFMLDPNPDVNPVAYFLAKQIGDTLEKNYPAHTFQTLDEPAIAVFLFLGKLGYPAAHTHYENIMAHLLDIHQPNDFLLRKIYLHYMRGAYLAPSTKMSARDIAAHSNLFHFSLTYFQCMFRLAFPPALLTEFAQQWFVTKNISFDTDAILARSENFLHDSNEVRQTLLREFAYLLQHLLVLPQAPTALARRYLEQILTYWLQLLDAAKLANPLTSFRILGARVTESHEEKQIAPHQTGAPPQQLFEKRIAEQRRLAAQSRRQQDREASIATMTRLFTNTVTLDERLKAEIFQCVPRHNTHHLAPFP